MFEPFEFRRQRFDWRRSYVMGVVNVTPDSFSDGGRYSEPEVAVAYAQSLIEAGADIIDIGGESTRPGATPVSADEEIARVLPVIVALAARFDTPLSIDTTKAEVARAAVEAGAEIVNDVSGGQFDAGIVDDVCKAGAFYVCGHVRGSTLAEVHSSAGDALTFEEVVEDLASRCASLPEDLRQRTVVDPCLGFGKDTALNLELVRRAGEIANELSCPVLVGASRKRFIGEIGGPAAAHVSHRDDATVGVSLAAVAGGANIVRVHDVPRTVPALRAFEAVRAGQWPSNRAEVPA